MFHERATYYEEAVRYQMGNQEGVAEATVLPCYPTQVEYSIIICAYLLAVTTPELTYIRIQALRDMNYFPENLCSAHFVGLLKNAYPVSSKIRPNLKISPVTASLYLSLIHI